MRILLAHNFYGSSAPSGENQVVVMEADMLRRRGHDVRQFVRHSDGLRQAGILGAVAGALTTPWNPFTVRRMRSMVREERPDVVHVHNTFPILSPAIFHAIDPRVARVLTLHNYRVFCPAAIPLRDREPCIECLQRRSVLPALRYGCYRSSRLATIPLAASVALHRRLGTWERHVDAFIALSEFQRQIMVEAGLPPGRTFVRPNFYPGDPRPIPWRERRDCAVFAGRLTREKGADTLVRAWLSWGAAAPELRILGSGPERKWLEDLARPILGRIVFLGQVSPAEAEEQIAGAKLVILPSRWFEGFPLVIREAFAHGTPLAVSDIGPMPSLVQHRITGTVFRPGDPGSLLGEVRTVWETPGLLEHLGLGARAAFETSYTEEANYRLLQEIYSHARNGAQDRVRSSRTLGSNAEPSSGRPSPAPRARSESGAVRPKSCGSSEGG